MLANIISGITGGGSLSANALKPVSVGGKGFAPDLRFDTISFDAAGSAVPMRYDIYVRRESRLQVALVFIIPKEVDRSHPIQNQINLSLQTLRIEQGTSSGAAPTPAASSTTEGGSPGF